MHITSKDIDGFSKLYRLNLINSITGIKPANLIGTISEDGYTNLAIFSSVVHMGSRPALIGFISRPVGDVDRNTVDNILKTKQYTINHVPITMIENAHYTSAKFKKEESEFEHCKFSEQYTDHTKAPYVKESILKFGLELVEVVPITYNDTNLIIGKVTEIITDEEYIQEDGMIDLEKCHSAGISGLNTYYSFSKQTTFPYARTSELPDFK